MGARSLLSTLLGRARRNLENLGLLALPAHEFYPLESAMGQALPRFRPTEAFSPIAGG